jgi:hypothetical protein
MQKDLILYECPNCNGHFGALPELAGEPTTCSYCKTEFTIPVGLTPELVPVSDSPGRPLTPEEDVAVRQWLKRQEAGKSLGERILDKLRAALLEVLGRSVRWML